VAQDGFDVGLQCSALLISGLSIFIDNMSAFEDAVSSSGDIVWDVMVTGNNELYRKCKATLCA
jgi:hypothetical protein